VSDNSSFDFTSQQPLEVRQRIEAGMRQADENADPKWKHMWDAIVVAVARRMPELTADDVQDEYETLQHPPGTHNMAAIGPAMKRAMVMGVLTHTDQVRRSRHPAKHSNRHNVWISNYYKEQA
jgi:hypothetical protein